MPDLLADLFQNQTLDQPHIVATVKGGECSFGGRSDFLRHPQEVLVGLLPGLRGSRKGDLQPSPIRSQGPIAELNLLAQDFPSPLQQACQLANAIPQKLRIRGMVNVGFYRSAVDPRPLALFHTHLHSCLQQDQVNLPQSLRPQCLHRPAQSRLRRQLVAHPDSAEASTADRITQMKGQISIAPAIHLFENQGPKYLVRRQTLGPLRVSLRATGGEQVLPSQLIDRRILIEEPRNCLQFLGARQIEPRFPQRALNRFTDRAHLSWFLSLKSRLASGFVFSEAYATQLENSSSGCALSLFFSAI